MKDSHSSDRRERAQSILSKHGYGKMKGIAAEAVHEHEDAEHGGKRTKLKLKDGGEAKGKEPPHRLDRKHRATGGRNKAHKEPKVSVNVINAGSKQQPMPMPMPGGMGPKPPMPMPAPQAPAGPPPGAMPPKPPMGGAPMPGGMPPGGMPQRPFAKGGPVRSKMDIPHLTGGAGGGLGRLEKAAHEKSRKKAV